MTENIVLLMLCGMICVAAMLLGCYFLSVEARDAYTKWNQAIDWMHFSAEELRRFTNDRLRPLGLEEASLMESLENADISEDKTDVWREIEYAYETDVRINHAEDEIYQSHERLYHPLIFIALFWLYLSGQIAPTEVRPFGQRLKPT